MGLMAAEAEAKPNDNKDEFAATPKLPVPMYEAAKPPALSSKDSKDVDSQGE